MASKRAKPETRIVVLRWGHRPRDKRVTTHVALIARAFGASGIIITDARDEKIESAVKRVIENWGGDFFIQMGEPWKNVVTEWKSRNGIVVHLSAYGENVQTSDVMHRIISTERNMLVIVGSQKVPSEFFQSQVSDFNVAVGNQPHSECSSLAVFLDRLFKGEELAREFKGSRLSIAPQKHGKKMLPRNRQV